MGLKLKENPRDWWKFTAGLCFAAAIVTFLFHRRGRIDAEGMWVVLGCLLLLLVLAALKPRLVRPLYRIGMTLAFYVGQVVGKVLLAIFFLAILTPLSFVIRLIGKDLLGLKPTAGSATYWQPVKRKPDMHQQF